SHPHDLSPTPLCVLCVLCVLCGSSHILAPLAPLRFLRIGKPQGRKGRKDGSGPIRELSARRSARVPRICLCTAAGCRMACKVSGQTPRTARVRRLLVFLLRRFPRGAE